MTQAPPARGSGDAGPGGRPARQPGRPPEGSGGALLVAFLGEQRARFEERRPGAVRGEPDAIHAMRVAARRARSALATYADLVDGRAGHDLGGELRWLGSALGAARDAEVVRRRLEDLLADQPESAERGRMSEEIEAGLGGRAAAGMSSAREALDSERYKRLLELLGRLLEEPPLTGRADEPAEVVVPSLLTADWRRLRRRARRAARLTGPERDAALHEVRKAAKRLRYAAQSAAPVLGEGAEQLATASAEVQSALGEHRDSMAAGEVLDGLAVASFDGPDHRLLHRLREAQRSDTAGLADDYVAAYRGLRRTRKRLRRVLR